MNEWTNESIQNFTFIIVILDNNKKYILQIAVTIKMV